jgi:plastocyanin
MTFAAEVGAKGSTMRIDSNYRTQAVAVARAIDGLQTGRLSRRDALRLMGGAGLATAAFMSFGRRAFAQDSGTPAAAVTPQIGPQADGSTLWKVKVGDMKMEELIELHAFFPGEITINAGDAIWFDFGMGGFHTVSFLSGGDLPPIFIPDPEAGTPTAGGPPKLILNPAILFPTPGDSYDGTGYANSGIDVFRDPSQPYVLKFTAPGTYDYLCIVHSAVMKARVVVQEAGTAAPKTQADYDQAAADEIAKLYEQAATEKAKYTQATSTQNADGTTSWEATVGAGGETQVRIQSFLPIELEIKAGDKVKWVNRSPGEPHTVSFIGAGEVPPEDNTVEQFADGTPKFVQSMETFLPQGGNVWHGTGWMNSGFTGIPQLGLPMEFEATFDTPGDYVYYCALHGDSQGNGMAAKLKVSPK